ncbi:MAG: hypothetical protein ABR529_07810 [Actinomycetota bacterium]
MDALVEIARHIERTADAHGWDSAPALFTLEDARVREIFVLAASGKPQDAIRALVATSGRFRADALALWPGDFWFWQPLDPCFAPKAAVPDDTTVGPLRLTSTANPARENRRLVVLGRSRFAACDLGRQKLDRVGI